MFKKIIFFYILMIAIFGLLPTIINKIFNPSAIVQENTLINEKFSNMQVKDFFVYENRYMYILTKEDRVYLYDIYNKKIEKSYQIKGITDIKKIVFSKYRDYNEKYKDRSKTFKTVNGKRLFLDCKDYLFVISKHNIHLVDLENATDKGILFPKVIFKKIKKPNYVYFNKYDNFLAVLENNQSNKVMNTYSLKTEKLLNSYSSEISINRNKYKIMTTMKNIPFCGWINTDDGVKKMDFFNQIEVSIMNRDFSKNIGEVTKMHHGAMVLPDMTNNFLWIYGTFPLCRQQKIILKETPYKAYAFSNSNRDMSIIQEGTIFVLYKDRLVCHDITKSFLMKTVNFTVKLFESIYQILLQPLMIFLLIFGGKQ